MFFGEVGGEGAERGDGVGVLHPGGHGDGGDLNTVVNEEIWGFAVG